MPFQVPPLRDASEHRTMRQVVVEKGRQAITQGRPDPRPKTGLLRPGPGNKRQRYSRPGGHEDS